MGKEGKLITLILNHFLKKNDVKIIFSKIATEI